MIQENNKNNKIVLIMNFLLNVNRRYDEFSLIFQLSMTVKNISDL